MKRKLES
jgi:hypothetical protein